MPTLNTIIGLGLILFSIWFAWSIMDEDNYTNKRGGF